MRRLRFKSGFAAFFSFLFIPSNAATRYVDATVGTSGDGTSWETAFVTIREGVGAAADDDTIIVAPGSYEEASFQQKRLSMRSLDHGDPSLVAATRVGSVRLKGADGSIINGFSIVGRDGMAISCHGSDASIINNLIVAADVMGGDGVIRCWNCSPFIGWNFIARNSGAFVGAILCDNSSPTIVNNTIVRNSSRYGLGGVIADDRSFPTIVNCIIWDNGEDLFNCSATYSCIKNAHGGEGNIAKYPYFVDPENGDYRLLPWSPCIDAGDPNSDFGEEPEPNGGRINMGAYGNTIRAAIRSPDTDGDGLPDGWEMGQFGNLARSGVGDADGDGILNSDEYAYGWDPNFPDPISAQSVTTGRLYRTIQAAICGASEGDEVVVLPGTYYENVSFSGKGITLRSVDPSDPEIVTATVLDGGMSGSVVKFCSREPADSVLTGFTITGGTALRGGGIRCCKSSPTIRQNIISGNTTAGFIVAASGGGIYSVGGSPTIEENLITGNEAQSDGGGLCFEGGSPSVSGNTINDNLATGGGGGIACLSVRSPVISGNFIFRNSAWQGGGLSLRDCQGALVSGNVIADNGPYCFGGGAYFLRTSGWVVNSTIAFNREYGLACGHGWNGVEVVNCVIWGNTDGAVWSETYSVSYSCLDDEFPGEGNIFTHPQFVDPENGDFRLGPHSPCIDAGNDKAPHRAETDIQGNPRILFGGKSLTVDMGAYEYRINDVQPGPGADEATFTWSSRWAKTYSILYSNDLLTWHLAVESFPSGGNLTTFWIDDGSLTGVPPSMVPRRFYRILENP